MPIERPGPAGLQAVRRDPIVALILSAVLAAGGCGSSTPSGSPSEGGSASGGPTGAVAATPPGQQAEVPADVLAALADPSFQRLSAAGEALDAAIDEQTGLVKAIGPELVGWLTDQRSAAGRAALQAAGVALPVIARTAFSNRPIAAAGPLTALGGEAWIGSILVAGVTIDAISNRVGETGQYQSDPRTSRDERTVGNLSTVTTSTMNLTLGVSGSTVFGDADVSQESATTDTRFGTEVVNARFRSRIHVELKICPDANGEVVLTSQIDITSDTAGALGRSSFQAHSTGERRGVVGDDAVLASETETQAMSYGTTGSNGVTQTGSGTTSLTTAMAPGTGRFGRVVSANQTINAGSMPAQESARWQSFLRLTADIVTSQAFAKAQALWQSGKCVRIEATERDRGVQLNERVPFTAKPVHVIEGVDLNKPVVMTFSGTQSATPIDVKQNPPAAITYTAGSVARQTGEVTLTSTSNRGIGKLVLKFRTEDPSYHIDQPFTRGQTTGHLKGDKCGGIDGEWILNGTYQGFGTQGVQKWTIQVDDSSMTGTFTYNDDQEGNIGGAPVKVYVSGRASGSVTVTLDADSRVKMHLKETMHTYVSTTSKGGIGVDVGAPLVESDIVWEVGAACPP